MNKAQMVIRVAEKTGLSRKEAELAVEAFLETIVDELKEEHSVHFVGFGTFELHSRKDCMARVPQTGEAVSVPACRVPVFRPSKLLKERFRKEKR